MAKVIENCHKFDKTLCVIDTANITCEALMMESESTMEFVSVFESGEGYNVFMSGEGGSVSKKRTPFKTPIIAPKKRNNLHQAVLNVTFRVI